MITLNLRPFPALEQINSSTGRTYKDSSGNIYESVTTFLGRISDTSWVEQWKDRIGHKEAEEILKKASERGNTVHEALEAYILQKPYTISNKLHKRMFESLLPYINKLSEVMCLETRLYAKPLGLAGTVDCIGVYDGVLSVVDFKTSTKVKTEEDIHNYWLQVTIYALMYYWHTGIMIEQVVILMTIEQSPYPRVFIGRTSDYIADVQKLLQ